MRSLRHAIATVFCLAAPLAAVAQGTITVAAGNSASVQVAPGSKLFVPIIVDMTAAPGANLAALTSNVSWGTARLTLDSVRAGAFGSLTANTSNAASGTAQFSVTSPTGTTSTVSVANFYFTAGATTGGTQLIVSPTVAGDEIAQNLLAMLVARNLDVCVAPQGKWGDVTGDGNVNIIDGQQVARASVGLSVLSAALVASQGDVTADGSVNIIDAQQIARASVGLSAAPRVGAALFTPPTVVIVAVTPPSPTVAVNTTLQMNGTPRDGTNTDVTGCASVSWSTSDPGIATVSSSGLVTGIAPGNATITATSGGHSTGVPITVVQVPTQLFLSRQPAGAVSGIPFTTQPVVEVRDELNGRVNGSSAPVTATLIAGTGTLSGTTTVSAVNGVATFTDLKIAGSGPHTLSFTAGPLSPATSNSVDVVQHAAALAIVTPPGGAVSGVALTSQPVIEVRDDANLKVLGFSGTIDVAKASGTGTLSGTLNAIAVNGTGTFSGLTLTGSGPHTLVFTSGALTSVTSAPFNLAQVPASLAIVTQPAGAVSGLALTTQPVIEIRDNANLKALGATNIVTASIASGTGTLSGTLTATAVNGTATFANLIISGSGDHTITFSSGALTIATSTIVTAVQVPASLAIVTQPSGAVSGLAFTGQPVVEIRDNANLKVLGAGTSVTATLASGTGALSGTTTVAAVNGTATFTDLSIAGVGAHTLAFSATAVPPITGTTSAPVVVTQAAASLAIIQQPTLEVSGAPFGTQPVVEVRDNANLKVLGSIASVTASIASGSGTLSGTTTVAAVNGVATFTNLTITGADTYTLTFTSGVLAPATTASFTVVPPTIGLNVGVNPTQTITNGTSVAIPIIVDMSKAGGQNLASLEFTIAWDPTKFTFVSKANGTFGTGGFFVAGVPDVVNGTLRVSVFDNDGFTSGTPTIYSVTLQAIASGTGAVSVTSTAAGSDQGASIFGMLTFRNLLATIP